MARPKGFEPLTPRFVVGGRTLNLLSFSANQSQSSPLGINTIAVRLQTKNLRMQHRRHIVLRCLLLTRAVMGASGTWSSRARFLSAKQTTPSSIWLGHYWLAA